MFPCLPSQSLKLLVGTADERYHFSPTYFRNTHFPQVLHRYYKHELVQEVTEQELFEELQGESAYGNRVYAILGSTGSGKSELLCWLRDQCTQKGVTRPVIRLSRTELNPQLLISRCYEALNVKSEHVIDDNRWGILLQKPITIVNQMIWTTLAEFFDTDEEIVPLAFMLRPIIEQNIREFSLQVQEKKIVSPLEIVNKHQFEHLFSSTTLPISVPFEAFRYSLLQKLEHFLFHGRDVLSILKHLSSVTKEKGVRPLILIDDLVQSMNIYASELLDYFITLEEGNWDIVIGLTPGSLQDSEKGTNLMHRILHLDTIDDRIQKLWLTDESGQSFYTLSRNEIVPYLEKYLIEMKKHQGYVCGELCPHATKCSSFLTKTNARLTILPLNETLMERIYDGIPSGKGKLRYSILHTRDIIRFLLRGTSWGLSRIEALLHRDLYISHPHPIMKILGEMFADSKEQEFQLPVGWLRHFIGQEESESLVIRSLEKSVLPKRMTEKQVDKKASYPSHLRDWIEGKKVNAELLHPIRSAISSLVQDATGATYIKHRFTPRSSTVLQRSEIIKGSKYPINLSERKRSNTLHIKKSINILDMYGFQQQRIEQKREIFSSLASDWNIAEWIYSAESLHDYWLEEIEKILGMPIDVFAFQLRSWMLKWVEVNKSSILPLPANPFSQKIQHSVEEFFLDWFALRDNIIDKSKLNKMYIHDSFEDYFLSCSFKKELDHYKFMNISFYEFLIELQQSFCEYKTAVISLLTEKQKKYIKILPDLKNISYSLYHQIKMLCKDINKSTISPSLIQDMEKIERLLIDEKIYEKYEIVIQQRIQSQHLLNNLQQSLFVNPAWEDMPHNPIEQVIEKIQESKTIPDLVRTSLIELITKGETLLPSGEERKILEMLQSIHPQFSKHVDVWIKTPQL